MSDIKFMHLRDIDNSVVNPRGGITIAYREVDDGLEMAFAACSRKDNYSKRFGRAVSSSRLNLPDHPFYTKISGPTKNILAMAELHFLVASGLRRKFKA